MWRVLSIGLCLCLCGGLWAVPQGLALGATYDPEPAVAAPTDRGRYRVSWSSSLQPLVINRMHAWDIHVASAAGEPIEGAQIRVSGGMPQHDHGLPTAPQVTADLGQGNYRIEGMRFHMGGAWEVVIEIEAFDVEDSLTVKLKL